jgi:hypothetical protein
LKKFKGSGRAKGNRRPSGTAVARPREQAKKELQRKLVKSQ